jgi:hypothetical protein
LYFDRSVAGFNEDPSALVVGASQVNVTAAVVPPPVPPLPEEVLLAGSLPTPHPVATTVMRTTKTMENNILLNIRQPPCADIINERQRDYLATISS